ncbi:uncharacterized protein NECHADRAFT_79829 [Fusarium vanettenii 77-13-4]|uniref:NAD(P)-binding domain-containing protein n=1 Tax=Fusarium vanettenii (strain ATCC MYA-4622 / CBS 123669 / FGSC 9596 / NRRL 45880 / 77-13-4) TaxID=660122 RepID=C7Z0B2_FUSV7|nr:uncharacterized protein NECHADRAFT_79829 [Fusarium vanettenii 77-13-4]EEU42174.1 hypothetical protein NECHADRAFT_79829 [Fusarium vanettenii 77-13-4]
MAKLSAIAVAGSGDIARYLAEEFVRDGQHDFHIISRTERPWFSELGVQFHLVSSYSKENMVELFDKFEISTVISTLTAGDAPAFVSLHQDILDACHQSSKCKRLIPSDFIGNVERFPDLPRRHADSRHAFRKILAQQSEVEWTTTSARDLSKAVVQLVKHPKWDRYTYVYGETGTWLEVIPKVEKLFNIKIEQRTPISREEIDKIVEDGSDPEKQYIASIDEWTVAGAGLVPMDVAEKQRAKFFGDVKFRTIEEFIREAQVTEFV